jgi:hypothetical protein
MAGIAQLVERQVVVLDVTGSSPVARPIHNPAIAALVLAGGKARRMGGGDKPLLEVGGASMLARVIAALRPDVAAIAISANGDPLRLSGFDLPVGGWAFRG